MISFRYHIVSIVSVFLALAVGVALGGGPLKGEVDNTLVEQVEADRRAKADLQAEIASLRSSNQFTDAFATGVAPRLVGGGSVGATVRVGEALVDVGQKQLVDELASQLLEGTPDVAVPEDASGYERLGALLARAVATTEDGGAEVDDASNSIMAGVSTAGLLSPAAWSCSSAGTARAPPRSVKAPARSCPRSRGPWTPRPTAWSSRPRPPRPRTAAWWTSYAGT